MPPEKILLQWFFRVEIGLADSDWPKNTGDFMQESVFTLIKSLIHAVLKLTAKLFYRVELVYKYSSTLYANTCIHYYSKSCTSTCSAVLV